MCRELKSEFQLCLLASQKSKGLRGSRGQEINKEDKTGDLRDRLFTKLSSPLRFRFSIVMITVLIFPILVPIRISTV